MESEREPKAGELWWVSVCGTEMAAQRRKDGRPAWDFGDTTVWDAEPFPPKPVERIPTPEELAELRRCQQAVSRVQLLVLDAQLGDHDRRGSDVVSVAELKEAIDECAVWDADPEPDVDEAQEWSDYDPDC